MHRFCDIRPPVIENHFLRRVLATTAEMRIFRQVTYMTEQEIVIQAQVYETGSGKGQFCKEACFFKFRDNFLRNFPRIASDLLRGSQGAIALKLAKIPPLGWRRLAK